MSVTDYVHYLSQKKTYKLIVLQFYTAPKKTFLNQQ